MSKNFKVTVSGDFSFNISETDALNLDAIELAPKGSYHVLQNNIPYAAKVVDSNFNDKSYRIEVNNKTYQVKINDGLDNLIKAMGFNVGASKQIHTIKAPMPGLILEINVQVGQKVKENDPLLVLEAMKMENSVLSPRQGTIKSVAVKKGDAVNKNQLLIEFND